MRPSAMAIAHLLAIVIDDGATPQNDVVASAHSRLPLL
jgi:hypothetical protein